MVKDELVEGIKRGMAGGETMEVSMNTFYNAGYPKGDIEEAAMAVQSYILSHQKHTAILPKKMPEKIIKPLPNPKQELPKPSKVIQRASNYEKKPSKTGTAITIILVAILLVLLAILAAVILFKDQLSNLLNSIF